MANLGQMLVKGGFATRIFPEEWVLSRDCPIPIQIPHIGDMGYLKGMCRGDSTWDCAPGMAFGHVNFLLSSIEPQVWEVGHTTDN